MRTSTLFIVLLFASNLPSGGQTPKSKVSPHLVGRPYSLAMRVNGKIVEAPRELLELAKSYPAFADKGPITRGRRITIMADRTECKVGEKVRVVRVLEAARQGLDVYVMGPKAVYDEYIGGHNVSPKPADAATVYDGKVLRSPAVDFNYDIASYTFDKPGTHSIQWKGGGHPIEGDLGLKSNVLNIHVHE